MKFEHDKNSLADALGVEQHKYALQLATIMTIVANDGIEKTSHISEMMHKCVDYNILLMLATNHLIDMVNGFTGETNFILSEN
jgi:hypothetical protein